MLKSLNLATLLLLLASGVSILSISQPGIVPPVQAQTNETKKAEAERLFNEGMQLFQQGTAESYQQAITKWEQALPLWRNLGDKAQEALINLALGRVYDLLGFKPKALEYFNQALPIYQSLKDRKGEARLLNNIGGVYSDLGEKQKALDYYQQALPLSRAVGDRAGEAVTLNQIGVIYVQLKEYTQAIDLHRQALAIYEQLSHKQKQAETLGYIANAYFSLGEYAKVINLFSGKLKAVGDKKPILEVMKRYLYREWSFNIAYAAGTVSKKLSERLKIDDISWQEAWEISQLNAFLAREVDDSNSLVGSLHDQGWAARNLGKYSQALALYSEALNIAREIKDQDREAFLLTDIGIIYSDFGQYDLALTHFNQALIIVKKSSDNSIAKQVVHHLVINSIGFVYKQLEQEDIALSLFKEALLLRQGFALGYILNNIGSIYFDKGELSQALKYYEEALQAPRVIGEPGIPGFTFNKIGLVHSEMGNYTKAIESYQKALVIFRKIKDTPGQAITLSNIGKLLDKQNQPELAIVFYKEAVKLIEEIRQGLRELSLEKQKTYTETVADTYRRLADLLLQQDRILEAQRVLDLLKVQELDDYLRGVRGNTNTEQGVPKLPPEQKIDEGIEAILNKAVEIGQEISRLQERQKLNGKLTPSEEQRLAQLWKQQEQIVAEFNKFIESPEVLALINQLKPQTRSADLLNNLDNLIGLSDNLKKLQQNAVLIYPIIFDDRLEIILTTADSPPVRHTVKVSKKELNETIRAFREALQNPNLDAKKPAQQLYEWLIKPLENKLKTADAKTIIYAPDGQLRYIPLAALYDGKQWLIERYLVNNITAASLTDFNTKPEPKMQILAAAFVKGSYQFRHEGQDFRFNGLPFAGIEVDKLAQTVSPTTKYFDKDFNQTIIPLLDSYTVVHFATHAAFVVGTPEQSFVLFGDGTVVTLQTMKNWRFKNIDLIVLSACETGLGGNYGTGIEILGLGYRLQTAGARAVIASLWSVDDGGTQALMNAFYAALRTGKLSKAAALQQAQIALITSNNPTNEQRRGSIRIEPIEGVPSDVANRLSHPRYWAPFILIGNGL
ncbi:MAG: CHAT domain-containing protein [Microcystis sp.]|uniref:CHAT domain-containing protein n=1 Tax=Microcystis sp. TaxID=1127 RepID=UPI00391D3CAC